jgi:hypothetical protein
MAGKYIVGRFAVKIAVTILNTCRSEMIYDSRAE